MRILVTGGRHFDNEATVHDALNALTQNEQEITVIQGGASGADFHAVKWTHLPKHDRVGKKIELITFQADWQKFGPNAGPIRNGVMLREGRPDVVLAFPGDKGTQDMVEQATKAGVQVIEIKS